MTSSLINKSTDSNLSNDKDTVVLSFSTSSQDFSHELHVHATELFPNYGKTTCAEIFNLFGKTTGIISQSSFVKKYNFFTNRALDSILSFLNTVNNDNAR